MKLRLKEQWKKLRRSQKLLLAAAIAALILLLFVLLLGGGRRFLLDSRTVKVQDPRDLKEQVQKDADESMFTIRINSQIILESPDAEAPLYIRNPKENKYDTYVELISDETQKTLYKSKTLRPGESILNDRLPEITEAGSHPYTACFYILEDGVEISTVEYAVTVEVKGGDTDG